MTCRKEAGTSGRMDVDFLESHPSSSSQWLYIGFFETVILKVLIKNLHEVMEWFLRSLAKFPIV